MLKSRLLVMGAFGVTMSLGLAACGGGSSVSGSSNDSGSSGATTTMNIETFAGDLGDTLASIAQGFEKKYNVHINWVEGSGVQNVARVAAAQSNQKYDAAFVPGQSQVQGTVHGYWAKLNPKVVDTSDVYPVLLAPGKDGVPVGLIVTDLYYNTKVFKQKGWTPPTSFNDLLDKKYCNKVGILDVTQTYGLYTVLGLGGLTKDWAKAGNLDGAFKKGLQKESSFKSCLPSVESSGGALEQKIQTGQYIIGTHGSVRILPLAKAGVPVRAVTPSEGAFLTESFVAPVKNAPHPKLAQEFVNWYLRPQAQEKLMTKTFYGPVIKSVKVPQKLVDEGVPNEATVKKLIIPDRKAVASKRDKWIDEFQRALG